ncbi:antitoxin Xre-like helix-turn-helix domain-containing protein [Morganella morganii]|uniref:HTH cro/C1-type domain-containing protein n=1 Tax=Morganella morganii TaxID=582 RepID=A0A6B7Q1Y1_MORMO|nr:helix-turn-helix transcriptional regulator [Morganella morganii]EGT3611230.1 helix-turn-helix domain-containing protein [Morganella morganii]EKW8501150.1 helix-turn-helix domain-containing protein [Morganella morganii]ELB1544648.1 helix-turn-helix domain-containing protein [Morganella morganii]MBS9572173.1 helix-turn-helix domain-containing protein [Morganella morganii subsp. morganii]MBS9585568.1 helix-turn-helix domain-containing protein [Morganella morganii subsp. morganii]
MNELKRLRDKLGLSNSELSELMGLSEQTIKNRMAADFNKKTISKLELEFLKLLAGEHEKYSIIEK